MLSLFLPAAGCRMTGIDGGDSWAYYETINAANNEKSHYVRITGSVFNLTWSAQRNIGFSVRLATVVSELTGELASVPACYGVPQYELGCWNL